MKIVIDISEKAYNALTHTEFDANLVVDEMRKAIANGIPLPEQQPCEDCISREAVLDIIYFEDKWLYDAKSHNADTKIVFSGLESRVKALPSVTPIISQKETVEDCISRADVLALAEKGTLVSNGNYKSVCKAINDLPSVTPKAEWIPVSERLPEDYIHVLCQFYLGGMGECYLAHGAFHVVDGLVMTCNKVIAWLPLPEPYVESEEEE